MPIEACCVPFTAAKQFPLCGTTARAIKDGRHSPKTGDSLETTSGLAFKRKKRKPVEPQPKQRVENLITFANIY